MSTLSQFHTERPALSPSALADRVPPSFCNHTAHDAAHKTGKAAICPAVQRFNLSHRGFVLADFNQPLAYVDAKWSTAATVEIFDIPPGTTVQAVSLEIIRAGGVEIFKANQRARFSELSLETVIPSPCREAWHAEQAEFYSEKFKEGSK